MNRLYTPLSVERYDEEQETRLRNDDIQNETFYILRALLEVRAKTKAGEFTLRTDSIIADPSAFGRLAVVSSLYRRDTHASFLYGLDGDMDQGLLVPHSPHGIALRTNREGFVGTMTEGYLLEHPDNAILQSFAAPYDLSEEDARRARGAFQPEYTDTRTGVLHFINTPLTPFDPRQ